MTFRSFCNVTNSLMNYFLFFKPKLFVLFLSLFSFLRFFCAHISTLHLFNSVTQSLSYLVSEMDVSLWDLYIITVVHSPSNLHTFIFNVIFLICQKVQETILHQIQLKHHGAGFTEFIAFIYIYRHVSYSTLFSKVESSSAWNFIMVIQLNCVPA